MYGMFPCMRLKIFAMSYTMQLAPWANMRLQLLLPKTSISIASCVKLRLALYTAKHVWNVSMYALKKFCNVNTMQLAPWVIMSLQLLLPKTSIPISSCVKLRLALYTVKYVVPCMQWKFFLCHTLQLTLGLL